MSEELTGNILIIQDGEPTATVNSTLAGAVTEALNHGCIEEIYGGLNGLRGLMNEEIIDLAEESQQVIRGLRVTPGAALGVSRGAVRRPEEFERILTVLEAHNICFLLIIGDRETIEAGARLSEMAEAKGSSLRVIGMPKSLTNELSVTDHCPGYGSVAKLIATTVKELAVDAASQGNHDLVSILEVGGGHTGWLAAASSLAKRRNEPSDPPHLILMPEVAFSPETFVEQVSQILKTHSYCQIVVGEGLVDSDGNYLATSIPAEMASLPTITSPLVFLRTLLEQHLSIKVQGAQLGSTQRCGSHAASLTDSNEAFLSGQSAVTAAVGGETGKMVTLSRGDTDTYSCETGLASLADIADSSKTFPANWINEDGISISYQFYKYASPLMVGEVTVPFENGTPQFVALVANRVDKRLEAYSMA
ncbi:diphosphate--fructose-6-phosphate 1-phosphotransferase [Ruficoccus sp. ZRK36]|uniref:diphosphate--fructose-6-phosphate 1-phosphotransferase n=1 Tax=Ruficoccus sp. ZRK36 TaxID=2866311 RepID=UPI001C72D69F|nr:diphosphate--fructose-6-phosphate 1-phosphotransferase [Ruficoccus sp. ZRK36]QYY36653.1 diphosphate--fructose-6-phosphate 1-phosphotransferase [Ruficoccus sp. ZRK36]